MEVRQLSEPQYLFRNREDETGVSVGLQNQQGTDNTGPGRFDPCPLRHCLGKMDSYKKIPSVTALLKNEGIKSLIEKYGESPVKEAIRQKLQGLRKGISEGKSVPSEDAIISSVSKLASAMCGNSFTGVVNATGVILHTNLGRSPLGEKMLDEIKPLLVGYSNLEFDLAKGKRGSRYSHIKELLKLITGAEDILVVNNNASGVILALSAFCKGGEVIISRGELVEIGGSFRLPDIMEFSGCKLVEVGATNKTKIADYEKAITENTRAILKVHKSNFAQIGFTHECEVPELANLCKKHKIPLFYDQGSGLLRKPANLPLETEPDVQTSIKDGADLVMFSCDKLLGGPQGGILAGKKELISVLSKTPLLRAVRISKMDLAAMTWACKQYLQDETLKANIPIFTIMNKDLKVIKKDAEKLAKAISKVGFDCEVVESQGQPGGGTLPHLMIPSYSVALKFKGSNKDKKNAAEKIFYQLMAGEQAVIPVLREGELQFDALTLFDGDIQKIAEALEKLKGDGQ